MENNYPKITQHQFDAIVMLMDDSIREGLHNSGADWQSNGEFLTAYLAIDTQLPIKDFKTGN